MTVVALYVETGGVYFGLPGVDPWDAGRDARLYAGPWPVVAHPPCNRWSRMAQFRHRRDGNDDGCFEAALAAVRQWGGVLEHPAYSLAWQRFGLARPSAYGWAKLLTDDGWTTEVDQRLYGFEMRKPTWLYYVGPDPPRMRWGKGAPSLKAVRESYGGGARQAKRSATPVEFRDALLEMARAA